MNPFYIAPIRERRGLSKEELAEKIGLQGTNVKSFSKYENGKRPLSLDNYLKLAEVLNVSSRWFFKTPLILDVFSVKEFLKELSESEFKFSIKDTDDKVPYIVLPESIKKTYLKPWREKKVAFKKGELSEEEYYDYKMNLLPLEKTRAEDIFKNEKQYAAKRLKAIRESLELTSNDAGILLLKEGQSPEEYFRFEQGLSSIPRTSIEDSATAMGILSKRAFDGFFFDEESDVIQFLLAVDMCEDTPVLIDAQLDFKIQNRSIGQFLSLWNSKTLEVLEGTLKPDELDSWLKKT